MNKSIIIIGAGLTGLAAGCYGQMNGYRTTIFEMHDKSGGVCTGWKRKGYTVDGAMNWLLGTKPGTSYHRFWGELGAAREWKVYNHDRFSLIEDKNGKTFTMYSDADRLEQEMIECAPEDAVAIRRFTGAIRYLARFDLPVDKPQELYGPIDYLKMARMLPFLSFVRKWAGIRSSELVNHFKNPLLRESFNIDAANESADMPALTMPMVLAWQHQKTAGYVIGGALALVDLIQRRYLDLGGELRLKAKVDKILVQRDRVVGVRLADGTEHQGDIVVSAADGRTTIFDMLEGKYIDDNIRGYYDHLPLFPPLVYIGLGIAREFAEIPPSVGGLTLCLKEPVIIAGKTRKLMNVLIYNFDPTLAPRGKTLVKVQFNTDYDYWDHLHKEPARYEAEKKQIADTVVALLDKRFPGLAVQVEMRDVATPMTWVRYTGNWRGSYEGWMITPKTVMMQMRKTLPGLDNFYMAGQWVNPGGGMPTAVMSGRHTIQMICKRDRIKFVSTTS